MMTDEELANEVVRLAIAAAGPIAGNEGAWLQRIREATPQIASLLRPPLQGQENDPMLLPVVARKVLESAVFKAEYLSHSLEESSQRIIVTVRSETTTKSDQNPDGTEDIRTEPMWSPVGRIMRTKLDALVPGQSVMIYKHMEKGTGKSYRVLAHLVAGRAPEQQRQQPLQDRRASEPITASAPQAESAPPDERAGSVPSTDPAPPSTDEHGPHWGYVQERLDKLTTFQKVAWKALAQGRGVKNFMDPTEDEIDRVIKAFDEVEAQHGKS